MPLVRAKSFFQKIKKNADDKNKYDRLVEDTLRAKDDIDRQNKEKLLTKIYKLYYYNKINNMLKGLDGYDKRLKNIYGKELLYKLLMIKTNNSSFNYNNNIQSTNQPKTTKLKFKNKIQKNDNIISDQNAPMRKNIT